MNEKRQMVLQLWASELALPFGIVNQKFKYFNYKQLASYFIIREREEKSYQRLAIRYNLSIQEVRTICDKCVSIQQGNA